MGKTSSSICSINYHVVFCSKHRKPVLGAVKEFIEETIGTIAEMQGFKILELWVMPDHIHFVSAPPVLSHCDSQNVQRGLPP